MFCRKPVFLNVILKTIKPVRNSSNLVNETKEKWEIFCGVCLERKPTISRPLNKLETSFSKMLQELELENSVKSEHELRHEGDVKRADDIAKNRLSVEDLEKNTGQTALEFEDSCRKELAQFTPASRITEADEKNDVKSTERKLDQHLLYIVNVKLGKEPVWILPQDIVKEDENLKTAAERILSEKFGAGVKAKFLGNAPCGFYKYKYPKVIQEKENATGAKVFFMKALYLGGSVDKNIDNYNWATRNELPDKFVDKYYNAVHSFLIDDEPVDLS
ncbi:large ribosomal subunit protein mL46 [Planococcus citri]|uniref:large ribosomal subunit protein mL46 n=1 Tax=Planococcus citri TaxID=170843 RepID=UPI0031F8F991